MTDNLPTLDYWSDALCVWAWLTQPRLDELRDKLDSGLDINYRFVNVFGDCKGKFASGWVDKGGVAGYRQHVQEVIEPHGLYIDSKTWAEVVPLSSLNAHLVLKAVQLVYGNADTSRALAALRSAFFEDGRDVSDFDSLVEIMSEAGFDANGLRDEIASGAAAAGVMSDYKEAETLKLRGSPSYVLDGGRQILYGDVSYGVLRANVEELLATRDSTSWC